MITISIDPVAFYLGPIEVRWYGIIVALAVLSLALWMWRRITANKDRIPPVDPTVAIPAVASGFGMAKLFHVIDGWDYYSQNLGEVFGGSGLSVFGGIIGVSLFSKRGKTPVRCYHLRRMIQCCDLTKIGLRHPLHGDTLERNLRGGEMAYYKDLREYLKDNNF